MKAIKMFGLAALTALMAMAFVGASSAMAENTALCGADSETCETETHVHETSVGKAVLLTSIGNTECEALFLGDVKSNGSPLVISGKFTYEKCTLGGAECTATEENGPSEIKVLKEGHETSKVTGEGLVKLVCGKTINCSYVGTGLVGTGKGPLLSAESNPNGEVKISGASTTKEAGGFLCPKESFLDITTTPLTATYIIKDVLSYCVETEHTNGIYTDSTCKTKGSPAGHSYKYTLILAPEGGVVNEIKCYAVLSPAYGLWKNSACTEDDTKNLSRYEKGKIVTVE